MFITGCQPFTVVDGLLMLWNTPYSLNLRNWQFSSQIVLFIRHHELAFFGGGQSKIKVAFFLQIHPFFQLHFYELWKGLVFLPVIFSAWSYEVLLSCVAWAQLWAHAVIKRRCSSDWANFLCAENERKKCGETVVDYFCGRGWIVYVIIWFDYLAFICLIDCT